MLINTDAIETAARQETVRRTPQTVRAVEIVQVRAMDLADGLIMNTGNHWRECFGARDTAMELVWEVGGTPEVEELALSHFDRIYDDTYRPLSVEDAKSRLESNGNVIVGFFIDADDDNVEWGAFIAPRYHLYAVQIVDETATV